MSYGEKNQNRFLQPFEISFVTATGTLQTLVNWQQLRNNLEVQVIQEVS